MPSLPFLILEHLGHNCLSAMLQGAGAMSQNHYTPPLSRFLSAHHPGHTEADIGNN